MKRGADKNSPEAAIRAAADALVQAFNRGDAKALAARWTANGSLTDERVGFSHTTGQITHHISPDVDAERDHLFHDLEATGGLTETYAIDDFHKIREGRNGGGDPWHTDGTLFVGVIAAE